jgi:hypothetical protein
MVKVKKNGILCDIFNDPLMCRTLGLEPLDDKELLTVSGKEFLVTLQQQ